MHSDILSTDFLCAKHFAKCWEFLKNEFNPNKVHDMEKDIEVKYLPFSLPIYFLIFVMPLWNYILTIYFKQAQKK